MSDLRITYYPWSQDTLNSCLARHAEGRLTTLDLDLTARCSRASCIYCDSKPRVGLEEPDELSISDISLLLDEAGRLGCIWIYTCGLGEPLEDAKFTHLVNASHEKGIQISLFTNGLCIDQQTAKWLRKAGVSLIVKLDTLDEATFDQILGGDGRARQIYGAIDCLLQSGFGYSDPPDATRLAISIVPTRINVHQIQDLLSFSIQRNIYPSIGELERAGRVAGDSSYDALSLTQEELSELKETAESLLWRGYMRPICPSVVTGVHIDNKGSCIVDEATGLNCKWFMLREPKYLSIGNIHDSSLAELFTSVTKFRWAQFTSGVAREKCCGNQPHFFGGCGGDPRRLIELAERYLLTTDQIHESARSNALSQSHANPT